MADIHVLTGDGLQHWSLILHFGVPDENNNVAVNYRTALVNSGLGGTSQMTEGTGDGQITSAELALIQAGQVYEHPINFPAESGATTNAQLLAFARALYAAHETAVVNCLKKKLRYFGYTGSKQ